MDHCSEQPHFKQSFIPVEDEVYDMPKFTQDEYQQLIKILTRGTINILKFQTLNLIFFFHIDFC